MSDRVDICEPRSRIFASGKWRRLLFARVVTAPVGGAEAHLDVGDGDVLVRPVRQGRLVHVEAGVSVLAATRTIAGRYVGSTYWEYS